MEHPTADQQRIRCRATGVFHLLLIITAALIAYFFLRVLAASTRPAIQAERSRPKSDTVPVLATRDQQWDDVTGPNV